MRTDWSYQMHVSYLEIYNDNGYDLLDPSLENNAKKLEDLPRVQLQVRAAAACCVLLRCMLLLARTRACVNTCVHSPIVPFLGRNAIFLQDLLIVRRRVVACVCASVSCVTSMM